MSYNTATSLAPASGFLLDMDPIKVSQEPNELKRKSHVVPAYLRHVTFHKQIFSLALVYRFNKVKWVGERSTQSSWTSTRLKQYDFGAWCTSHDNVHTFFCTLCILFKKWWVNKLVGSVSDVTAMVRQIYNSMSVIALKNYWYTDNDAPFPGVMYSFL